MPADPDESHRPSATPLHLIGAANQRRDPTRLAGCVMVAAHIRIAPLAPTVTMDPLVIRNLIYKHATPDDRVEHVRIHAGPQGADIFAFIDVDDPSEATRILHRLVVKTTRGTPLLRLWRIV